MSIANGTAPHRRRKADGEACRETRPQARSVNPEGIPAELRDLKQWVVWRYEWREDKDGKGKWTKVPYVARQACAGREWRASSVNPRTWDRFDRAVKAYQAGGWNGIGFVFASDDPYTGIDLDDCRDPDTGILDAWAVELLALLDAYAEVSPSGTGVKAIVRAKKPKNRCKAPYSTGEVEAYDRGRYFCLTGEALPDARADFPDRQQAVEEVCRRVFPDKPPPSGNGKATAFKGKAKGHNFTWRQRSAVWSKPFEQLTDEEILVLAYEADNAPKFRALMDGDTSGHDGDDSRADAALCAIFAYWTRRDAARIDRLFRWSKLYRPKWDEVHSGEGATYGAMTIAYAISKCDKVYSGPQPEKKGKRRRQRRAETPPEGGATPSPDDPTDTVGIIRKYWRVEYDFVFKRGADLYSARLGRPVKRSEACSAPSSELVPLLLAAVDGPEDEDSLHKHFGNWSKTAYVDELRVQPAEEKSGAGGEVCTMAMEQFRLLVRVGLRTIVALGSNYDRKKEGGDRTEVERKPLIEFACSFAGHNGKRWGSVRGMSIWSKLVNGHPVVAVRNELFGELRCCHELMALTYDKFADLCVLYGVGSRCKVKGGDSRAVLLDDDFLGDMTAEPDDEVTEEAGQADGQPASPAHTREEVSGCPGWEEDYAN